MEVHDAYMVLMVNDKPAQFLFECGSVKVYYQYNGTGQVCLYYVDAQDCVFQRIVPVNESPERGQCVAKEKAKQEQRDVELVIRACNAAVHWLTETLDTTFLNRIEAKGLIENSVAFGLKAQLDLVEQIQLRTLGRTLEK